MNWLSDIIRPRIRSLVGEQKEVPDNLWTKCPSCEGMLFHRDLEAAHNVCYHCNHHLRITVKKRLELLFDDGKYETIALPDVAHDPLKFKDRKKYSDRLKESQKKTGLKDAITIAKGTVKGQKLVVAAFNFSFMGGSMGAAVGEGIVRAAEEAVKTGSALMAIPASGGARMQEGMLSLIQMPRSIIAVEMVKEAKLPYLILLTDPTTGGVSASFAMVGDVHLAEPGATIGFAGRRVIEETVRETLPADFQTAEYLLEHGIVDVVVDRKDMHDTVGRILSLLMQKENGGTKPGKKTGKTDNKNNAGKGKNAQTEGAATAPTSAAHASKQAAAASASVKQYKQSTQSAAGKAQGTQPKKRAAAK